METQKWGKLLWRKATHRCWGILGKRFWFADDAHGREYPKQVEFQSFCPQYNPAIRVPKGWPSIYIPQVLGASAARTIVESSIILWLHTLVLAGGTRCLEQIVIPLFLKLLTSIKILDWLWQLSWSLHSIIADSSKNCL